MDYEAIGDARWEEVYIVPITYTGGDATVTFQWYLRGYHTNS